MSGPLPRDATANTNPVAVQAACAKQAEHAFLKLGYNPAKDLVSFANHYNPSLNVCFLSFDYSVSDKNGLHLNKHLSDAYEGKEYGAYTQSFATEQGIQIWDCRMLQKDGSYQSCHSEEEFDAMRKRYLEQ